MRSRSLKYKLVLVIYLCKSGENLFFLLFFYLRGGGGGGLGVCVGGGGRGNFLTKNPKSKSENKMGGVGGGS